MQGKSTFDSSEIMHRADKLMNAASNRYRITVQVANRAKRRRYEDMDGYENPLMKPPVRAIIEMSDELTQPEIIKDYDENISKSSNSSDLHCKTSKKCSSYSKDLQNLSRSDIRDDSSNKFNSSNYDELKQHLSVTVEQKDELEHNKNVLLNLKNLKSNLNTGAWYGLANWIDSSLVKLDRDEAKNTVNKLKLNHKNRKPYYVAHTLIIQKSFKAATLDLAGSILHPEIISGLADDKLQNIPYSEHIISILTKYIISHLKNVEIKNITQLCVEMVYQIAVIYNKEWQEAEQEKEILSVFGLALIGEKALETLTLSRCGNIKGMAFSASVKALMIFAIGNAACVYYNNYNLVLSGELEKLVNLSKNYLDKITNQSEAEEFIEQEIKYEFSINYTQIEKYLKEKILGLSLK